MNSFHIAVLLFRRTFTRKRSYLLYLLLPALVVSLAVSVISGASSSQIKLVIVNEDQGLLAELLIQEWHKNPQFVISEETVRERGEAQLQNKQADNLVVIPSGFTNQLLSGQTPVLDIQQLPYNQALAVTGPAVRYLMSRLAETVESRDGGDQAQIIRDVAAVYAAKSDKGSLLVMFKKDQYSDERTTLSTGLLILFVLLLATNSISLITRDRKNRTLLRMYASPLTGPQIAIGHFIGCYMTGTLQISFVLILSRLLFRAHVSISLLEQWLVLECFLLAALGMAMAITGLARNNESSGAFNTLIITPTCMIGGCFWPFQIMPDYMQKLANFVPQKWAIEAISILSTGGRLADVALHLAILTLFGLVLLSFGTTALLPDSARAD